MEAIKQNVHSSGRCSFDMISPNKIVTCGIDGSCRQVGLEPLEDSGAMCYDESDYQFVSLSTNPINRKMFALAKEKDQFDGRVELLELRSDEQAHLISRVCSTNMGLCDLEWTHDGEWLIIATDSDGIKVLKISNPVDSLKTLKEHTGAVKGVCCDPKGEYMCSIGSDGSMNLYKCKDWSLIKSFLHFCEKDTSIGASVLLPCKPQFSDDGMYLACPGNNSLLIFKRGDWENNIEFENPEFSNVTTHAVFSSSSSKKKLVACCCSGKTESKLIVWDLSNKKILFSFLLDTPLCDLKFIKDVENGKERLIGLNTDGEIIEYDFEVEKERQQETQQVVESTLKIPDELFEEEKDEDQSSPTTTLHRKNNEEQEEEPITESLTKLKQEYGRDEEGQPIHFQMDNEMEKGGLDEKHFIDIHYDISNLKSIVDRLKTRHCESFQPGSSKFGDPSIPNEDSERRFLAWNVIGSIVCRKEKTSDRVLQSIEIEFADSSTHRPVRFPDEVIFDKASLSENGAFFSSSPSNEVDIEMEDDDDEKLSQNKRSMVHFRTFKSPWPASSSTWEFTLSKRENVTAIACGKDFCVATTNRGFLRVFRSLSGLQDPVSILPGPICCISAIGSLLLLIYHTSTNKYFFDTNKVEQELGYQLIDFNNGKTYRTILSTGSLPCPQGIVWCGFGDESLGYLPMIYRKDGVLLGLHQTLNNWIVLSDGINIGGERGIRLWPISASRKGGLLAVALRQGKRSPSVTPRSTPSLYPIRIPLLGIQRIIQNGKALNKYDHEENALLDVLILDQRRGMIAVLDDDDEMEAELTKAQALADVAILRGMIVSIKTKNFARALGLAERFRLNKTFSIAIEKAQEAGADEELLERLVALSDERNKEQEEEEEEEEEEPKRMKPTNLKRRFQEVEDEEEEEEEEEERVITQQRKVGRKTIVKETLPKEEEEEENDDEEETTAHSTKNGSSVRVEFENKTPQSPISKFRVPPNPFLKSASPVSSEKKPTFRASPIRSPQLSRDASFTVHVREQHRKKL